MKSWLLLFAILPGFCASAATISMQHGIELLVLNGEKVEETREPALLRDGKNQIVVEVHKEFPKGKNSEIFSSSPYVIMFDETGGDLVISLPKRTNDYRKVTKAFREKNPDWQLMAGSKSVKHQSDPLPGSGGFVPYANIAALVAEYNKANGIGISSHNVEDLNEMAVTVADNGKIEISGDALTQLKLWYSKATPEEIKTFRKWMIDQE